MTPRTLEIHSRSRSYQVYVGHDLLAQVGAHASRLGFSAGRSPCAVVTDNVVAGLYADTVLASLREHGHAPTLVTVPAGESSKSMEETGRVAGALIDAGLDRSSFIVALGGGVVGDLAGFVASIYFRGIPFIQVPTTIIAQVDSAIGGKTGVNTPRGKNLLGTFHPPALVLADVETLRTLPEREFNEGFAEIIKHGVIRDRPLLTRLETFERTDEQALLAIILRNLEIKAEIVAADEFERSGTRALLNFGHTIGHAIESAAGYGRFLHGEAISLGMVAAARLSMEKAGLQARDYRTILALLERFHLPTSLPGDVDQAAVFEALATDKKSEGGQFRFVLTPNLGEAFLSDPGQVAIDDARRVIAQLQRSPSGPGYP